MTPLQYRLTEQRPIRAYFHVYFDLRRATKSTAPDMHYALELGVVLSGVMTRYYEDLDATLGPGQVWLSGLWEPHAFALREAPCRVMILCIRPELLANLEWPEAPELDWLAPFVVPPRKRPQAGRATRAKLQRLAPRIKRAARSNSPLAQAWLRHYLQEIVLRLHDDWQGAAGRGRAVRTVPYGRITPALELMLRDGRRVAETEAAATCGLNKKAFRRAFRSLMGVSFPAFCRRYRLGRAAEELRAGDAALKGIAAKWGFSDPSHFSRSFQRQYGCTPGEYRKRQR